VSVAFAQMMTTKTGDSTKGKVFTNDAGMTLYVFDKDSGGKSACNGACAGNWPPLMAAAGAMPMNDYTVIAREDGAKQWAYKGRPLYTWKNDKKPRRRFSQRSLAYRSAVARSDQQAK